MTIQALRRTTLAAAVISVAALLVPGTVATAAPSVRPAPHVQGTQTVPVYDYANAVRESVWVTTPLDNDGDGVRDKVVVDLIHPREAAQSGVKVPVIMDASPYYQCCGRGNESERKRYDAAE